MMMVAVRLLGALRPPLLRFNSATANSAAEGTTK